jgi:hypothetical protein
VSARTISVTIVPAVVAFAVTTASPASFVLTNADKDRALAYGKSSASRESFDDEWRVKNAAGDTVSVITPFHRLVVASRHATFRDEPLPPGEPDKLLREMKNRLMLQVDLHGDRDGFARLLAPELLVGSRTVKAAFVQNDRTPRSLDSGRYLARCVYAFPVKDLHGTDRVTLVVRDADAREVSRFPIDLSRMR